MLSANVIKSLKLAQPVLHLMIIKNIFCTFLKNLFLHDGSVRKICSFFNIKNFSQRAKKIIKMSNYGCKLTVFQNCVHILSILKILL